MYDDPPPDCTNEEGVAGNGGEWDEQEPEQIFPQSFWVFGEINGHEGDGIAIRNGNSTTYTLEFGSADGCGAYITVDLSVWEAIELRFSHTTELSSWWIEYQTGCG
jgi:hypothetical protein